jgi:hypothetical protein
MVGLWKKLLPYLEKDLQGFPKKAISKSDILDMVYTMRSSENINEDNVEE